MDQNKLIEHLKDDKGTEYIKDLISGEYGLYNYNEPTYYMQINAPALVKYLYSLYSKYDLQIDQKLEESIKTIFEHEDSPNIIHNTLEVLLSHIAFERIGQAAFKMDNVKLLTSFKNNIIRNKEYYKEIELFDNESYYESIQDKNKQEQASHGINLL